MKKCTVCGKDKELKDYSKDKFKLSGYKSQCRECINERNRNQSPAHREKNKWRKVKLTYGITKEDYYKMLSEQKGVCQICGKSESEFYANGQPRALSIDHCHSSAKVRGLLCAKCNTTLGQVGENIEVLQNMIKYLITHSDVAEKGDSPVADAPDCLSGGDKGNSYHTPEISYGKYRG